MPIQKYPFPDTPVIRVINLAGVSVGTGKLGIFGKLSNPFFPQGCGMHRQSERWSVQPENAGRRGHTEQRSGRTRQSACRHQRRRLQSHTLVSAAPSAFSPRGTVSEAGQQTAQLQNCRKRIDIAKKKQYNAINDIHTSLQTRTFAQELILLRPRDGRNSAARQKKEGSR